MFGLQPSFIKQVYMKQVLTLIFILLLQQASAQNPAYAKLLQYYNSQKNFNGAVLVATKGKVDLLSSKGISSRQLGARINTRSKFKIASITKTFTAVMILQLMEAGKLNLNATIGQYFPAYTGEGRDRVTVEHLLTYSSGIPNCESYMDDAVYGMPVSIDSFIIKYCSGKPDTIPGSRFSYNNGDYIILGKIIEKITGKTFAENLQQRILDPLGLRNSGMLYSSDIIPGLVSSYVYNDSLKTFNADKPYYIENYFSAGAMYSTVEDLLTFDQAIFTYKLLKKQTVDLMLTPHPALGNVGLGFWISDGYGALDTPFAYRPGGIYGSSANWIHVIGANKTIIVLSNTDAANLFEMSQQLYAIPKGH